MVHKRIAKAIKKRLPKKEKIYEQARKEDILPDLPGLDPVTRLGMMALVSAGVLNPYVAATIAGYMLAENTERYWGEPLYGRFIPPEVSRRRGTQARGIPSAPPIPLSEFTQAAAAPLKRSRKTSKANKATKMAWQMLIKDRKGKLTKSACQKLLKKCSMIASKANPNTKSRIGKAKNGTTKACKKIRKAIWGTNKRY